MVASTPKKPTNHHPSTNMARLSRTGASTWASSQTPAMQSKASRLGGNVRGMALTDWSRKGDEHGKGAWMFKGHRDLGQGYIQLSPAWTTKMPTSTNWDFVSKHKTLCLPEVPHKAVAEVSNIDNSRRGGFLWCMDDRANPLMDPERWLELLSFQWLQWSPHPQLLNVQ